MSDGVKLAIFSAAVLAAAYASSFIFPLPPVLPLLLSFYFTAFTFVLNRQLLKAYADENKNKFTQVFMGFTGVKIFSSLILLAVFIYLFKDERLYVGLCVLSYYLLYTFFEVALWRARLKA